MFRFAKGQFILKGIFDVFKSTKKQQPTFSKNIFFSLNHFLEARAEILTIFLVDLKTPKSPFEIN